MHKNPVEALPGRPGNMFTLRVGRKGAVILATARATLFVLPHLFTDEKRALREHHALVLGEQVHVTAFP